MSLRQMRISLTDDSSPTISALSGSLTSPTSFTRTRSLSYSASDLGGGIYRQRLLVDGVERVSSAVDENDGKCVRYANGGGFAHRVPCKLSASGAVSFDTGALSDGAHEVTLEVYDATATNKVASGPWPITVDNVAPTVGTVGVAGVAQAGSQLHCAATVNGQTPSKSFQWLRANLDGSGASTIAGATAAAYALTAADVGKKVLCRVTGTDRGGSASRTSTLTTGPFADGGIVRAQPVGAAPASGGGVGSGAPASGASAGLAGSGAGAASGAVAAAAAAVAAVPACSTATVSGFNRTTTLTRSYARSSVSLAGRLVGTSGEPKAGRVLDVVQTVMRAGAAQRTTVGSIRTGADGGFRVTAPAGPSRALQVVDAGCGAVGPVITQRVRGAIQAKTTTRRVRNRQTARISGRVLGGHLGRGIPLELQVKVGRQWRDVKHTMTNAQGGFRVGYRFMRTYVRYTYRFRVVTRAGGAWPYMPAISRVVKVRVN